jgi:hypothetical protein
LPAPGSYFPEEDVQVDRDEEDHQRVKGGYADTSHEVFHDTYFSSSKIEMAMGKK